jgi:hypothetical protein
VTGSHFTWGTIPPAARVCFGCGDRLTIARSGPLTIETDAAGITRPWHFACWRDASPRGESAGPGTREPRP